MLAVLLALSGMRPYDHATWLLEVAPVLAIVPPLLWATYPRFPLTRLLYVCIFCHAVVLIVGGTYTYARVPLGFYLEQRLDLSRNPYDRIGHLFQGFVPALAAREILIRGQYVRGRKLLAFVVVCDRTRDQRGLRTGRMGRRASPRSGRRRISGHAGRPWDTQSDMFCALLGSLAALTCFSRVHPTGRSTRCRCAPTRRPRGKPEGAACAHCPPAPNARNRWARK